MSSSRPCILRNFKVVYNTDMSNDFTRLEDMVQRKNKSGDLNFGQNVKINITPMCIDTEPGEWRTIGITTNGANFFERPDNLEEMSKRR